MMAQSVAVEIDATDVEPVTEPALAYRISAIQPAEI